MTKRLRNIFCRLAAALLASAPALAAEEVTTLRLHHFMSAKSSVHAGMLEPFAERIAEASGGRLRLELFPAMSLGGRPSDLYDQAVDGAVDIVVTVPGYTAGRFNRTETFELPFIMQSQAATAKAFWDFIDSDLQDGEYSEARVLTGWVHGPGVLHSKTPISKLEDLAGREIRGPTRMITDLLGELGAQPVGMPLPKIPESLSKGVISGTALPWSITPSIRLSELVGYHAEMGGDRALYTTALIMAMNHDAYNALPADLRAVLDAETGKALAEISANVMAEYDDTGRAVAAARNSIAVIGEAEVRRWVAAAQPVYVRFIERSREKGFDGEATIAQVRALIAANQ